MKDLLNAITELLKASGFAQNPVAMTALAIVGYAVFTWTGLLVAIKENTSVTVANTSTTVALLHSMHEVVQTSRATRKEGQQVARAIK